jgi:hypothetical protein
LIFVPSPRSSPDTALRALAGIDWSRGPAPLPEDAVR